MPVESDQDQAADAEAAATVASLQIDKCWLWSIDVAVNLIRLEADNFRRDRAMAVSEVVLYRMLPHISHAKHLSPWPAEIGRAHV